MQQYQHHVYHQQRQAFSDGGAGMLFNTVQLRDSAGAARVLSALLGAQGAHAFASGILSSLRQMGVGRGVPQAGPQLHATVNLVGDAVDKTPMSMVTLLPERKFIPGCILGKGGSEIRRIAGNSGARVKLDNLIQGQKSSEPRRVLFSGTVAAVTKACDLASQCIHAEMIQQGEPGLGHISIVVPANLMPLLRGAEDATVKRLNSDSGATVELDATPALPVGGVVKISGSLPSIAHAHYLITRILSCDDGLPSNWKGQGLPDFFNPPLLNSPTVSAAVAAVAAASAASSAASGQAAGAAASAPQFVGEQRARSGSGTVAKYVEHWRPQAGGGVAGQQAGGKRAKASKTMAVPAAAVSFLIGARGSKITNMRAVSSCQISIANEPDPFSTVAGGEPMKTVTISGPVEKLAIGEAMVLEALQEYALKGAMAQAQAQAQAIAS